jgi:hypothetical protein
MKINNSFDETKFKLTLLEVEDLINTDHNSQICNIDLMKDSLTFLIKFTDLIDKLVNEIFKCLINLKINLSDLPLIVNIILESKDLIINYNNSLLVKIDSKSLKYYIFGILYYILLLNNIISKSDNNNVIEDFEIIWKFIIFDINTLSNIENTYSNLFNNLFNKISNLYFIKK